LVISSVILEKNCLLLHNIFRNYKFISQPENVAPLTNLRSFFSCFSSSAPSILIFPVSTNNLPSSIMDILQRKKNPWIEGLVKSFPGGIPKQSFAQLLAVNPSVGSCSVNDGACVIDAIIQPDCLAAAGLPFSAMEGFVVKLTEFSLSVIGVGSNRRLGLRVSKMEVHSADNINAVGPSKPIYSSPAYKQISIDAPPSPLRAPSALTQLALHVASPSVATVPASRLPKGIQLPVITGCISAASCAIPPHSARLLDAIVVGWRSEPPAVAAAPIIVADSQALPPPEAAAEAPVVVNVHDSLIWRYAAIFLCCNNHC
jgi:hypothetical protein